MKRRQLVPVLRKQQEGSSFCYVSVESIVGRANAGFVGAFDGGSDVNVCKVSYKASSVSWCGRSESGVIDSAESDEADAC